jgi:hypothetical protein
MTFIYADAAGGTVFEYTANKEYAVLGNTYVRLEKAFVLPLNTMLLPDHVPDPDMLFPDPDLSRQIVTAVVEFIVELSPPSIHSVQPGISTGAKYRENGGMI